MYIYIVGMKDWTKKTMVEEDEVEQSKNCQKKKKKKKKKNKQTNKQKIRKDS